jgi:hypothetical protein
MTRYKKKHTRVAAQGARLLSAPTTQDFWKKSKLKKKEIYKILIAKIKINF